MAGSHLIDPLLVDEVTALLPAIPLGLKLSELLLIGISGSSGSACSWRFWPNRSFGAMLLPLIQRCILSADDAVNVTASSPFIHRERNAE